MLKGFRFVFLRNNEDLPEDARPFLKNMRDDFQDSGDAYMFKEALRSIQRRQRIHATQEWLFSNGAKLQKKPKSRN